MLYVGMGLIYVNVLLFFFNILIFCVFILKVREREIGFVIENIVNKFCDLEMEEEKMEWGCI